MELWHKIFLILAGIGNLSLAVFILSRGRGSRIHVTFSVSLFFSVLWIISVYFALHYAMEKPNIFFACLLGKLAFAFGSFTSSSFLVFTEVFPMSVRPDKVRRRMFLYYGLGAAAFILALTPFLQSGLKESPEGIFVPEFGWGLHLWGAFLVWSVGYTIYKLVSKYRILSRGHEKTQLKYTFLGMSLVGIAAVIVNILVFLFNQGPLPTVAIGPAAFVFMVALITFAIVRHRLMDLGVVFRSALIYFIVITLLIGINLIFLVFLNQQLGLPPWVSVIFSSTVLVLTVVPLRNKVEEFCYAYVFKIRRHEDIIEEISGDLTSILDLDGLRRVVVDKLVDILKLESGSMLISNKDMSGYPVVYSTFGDNSGVAEVELENKNILIKKLETTKRMLLLSEFKRTLPEEKYGPYAEEFARLRSVALLPLLVKNVLIGIISLGSKKSDDIYSYQDINMLNILGNHMAAALENSRLFDEILAMKNHYSSILHHLSSGVITMHPNQTINAINQRAKNILNLSHKNLIGESVAKLGKVLSRIMINRQTTPQDFYDHEIYLEVPGRDEVPLDIICTVMRDEKGPPGVLMVINDLTVEKQLQAKIRRTDRLASIGTLAAGMAHEIKNPLVSIKTFSQLLPEKFDDKDFREKFSSITTREVERINHIVEQLLHFARPMKPRPKLLDLHNTIDEVLGVLHEEIERKKAEIIREYVDSPATVMIDANQMKQVFINLFMNSLQAIENGGRIEVKTEFIFDEIDKKPPLADGTPTAAQLSETDSEEEMTGRRLMITITDNGKGIPKDMLQNLFDPFFTTRSEGFGLGLAIVLGIIIEHNATVEIESEESMWTRVKIKIPAGNRP